MTTVKVEVGAGGYGGGVTVDGHPVKGVVGIQFGATAGGTPPVITLHVRADVEIEAEVEKVAIMVPGQRPEAAMLEMLEGVAAEELEGEALGLMGGLDGGPATPTEAILEVLKKWVRDG